MRFRAFRVSRCLFGRRATRPCWRRGRRPPIRGEAPNSRGMDRRGATVHRQIEKVPSTAGYRQPLTCTRERSKKMGRNVPLCGTRRVDPGMAGSDVVRSSKLSTRLDASLRERNTGSLVQKFHPLVVRCFDPNPSGRILRPQLNRSACPILSQTRGAILSRRTRPLAIPSFGLATSASPFKAGRATPDRGTACPKSVSGLHPLARSRKVAAVATGRPHDLYRFEETSALSRLLSQFVAIVCITPVVFFS